ncbi:hypothetical protein L1887_52585 [Cichorium endivia]|nr:hypothetical protein L1887_52585 [Cichorium endivia]
MTTATDAFMRDIKPFFIADALADFTRDEHLMSLNYVAGRSGRVVMTDELLPSVPATKAALCELILPLLDESDEPMDDENLIDYGLDSVRMMALAARWRKVHGDIDFVMLAKNPTIDAWWALLSREVHEVCGRALASLERLDVLINAAGILRMGATDQLSQEDWQQTFAVNVGGAVQPVPADDGPVPPSAGRGDSHRGVRRGAHAAHRHERLWRIESGAEKPGYDRRA